MMNDKVQLFHGDCLFWLSMLPDCSVDSIVTDPPYGLSFMGKKWDYDVPSVDVWAECLRVLKPGGHLLAFAGTRTQHRMAVRIEDAGFEIRDMIAWVYGSGFPKSLDVSKAIDKAAGAEREKVLVPTKSGNTQCERGVTYASESHAGFTDISNPVTDAARQWAGWGTALKPALEPITVARKPLVGTVAENVLAHETGALNVDGCRVEGLKGVPASPRKGASGGSAGGVYGKYEAPPTDTAGWNATAGRWPANLIHDGSDEVVGLFPTSASPWIGNPNTGAKGGKMFGGSDQTVSDKPEYRDSGSAARFFYCAKASKRDRDEGPDAFTTTTKAGSGALRDGNRETQPRANTHPTVKPTDLMRYLCRLVTPPGGTVLDPFMGSGSTGKAAMLEGFRFIGCERDPEYIAIAQARIENAQGPA